MSVDRIVNSLERAVEHLETALEALNSAGTWSFIDVIGFGGIFADIFEYSEFGKAKREVELAADIIRNVKSELTWRSWCLKLIIWRAGRFSIYSSTA